MKKEKKSFQDNKEKLKATQADTLSQKNIYFRSFSSSLPFVFLGKLSLPFSVYGKLPFFNITSVYVNMLP